MIQKKIITEINNNIYVIKNKFIRLQIKNDEKNNIDDFDFNTQKYFDLISQYNIFNIIKLQELNIKPEYNDLIKIDDDTITELFYDFCDFKTENNTYMINTSNIINIIINCVIYYFKNYNNNLLDEFKKILKNNLSRIIIDKQEKNDYIKILISKTFFTDLYNMNLPIHIQLYNKNFNFLIEKIFLKDNIIFKILNDYNKNISYIIGKFDENLNYKYDVIDNFNLIIETLDLEDFNNDFLNIIFNKHLNEINKSNTLTNKFNTELSNNYLMKYTLDICSNNKIMNFISSESFNKMLHYIFVFKNKYDLKIKEIKISFEKSIFMKDKNNNYICHEKKFTIGRRKVIFLTLDEDNYILNLKKNDCIGFSSVLPIKYYRYYKYYKYYKKNMDKFFINKKKNNSNSYKSYDLNIIGEIKTLSLYNIKFLSYDNAILDFINVIKN